jgi:putative RecB family exonuclease
MSHRSYSQVSTYLNCPKQYELGRVLKLTEPPAWYLIAGSAIHSVMEQIGKQEIEPVDYPDQWRTAFQQEIDKADERGIPRDLWRTGGRATKDKPNGEDYDFWLLEGEKQVWSFGQWFTDRLEEGWEIPVLGGNKTVEIEMNVSLDGVMVKGYADLMMRTPTGDLMVIDHKTGSRTPDTYRQLALYALAMRLLGFETPTLGAYYMTRKAELSVPTQFLEDDFLSLIDTFAMVDQAIKAEIFPAKPSSMCKSCGVAQYCAAVNGEKAKENDPVYARRGA